MQGHGHAVTTQLVNGITVHCVLILGSSITEEVHISVGLKARPLIPSKEKHTKKRKIATLQSESML